MDLVAGRSFADDRRPIRHLDPVLIGAASVLSIIGLFLIYSSKYARLVAVGADPMYYVKKQVTAMVLGLLLLLLVALVDYRFFKVYAGFIYAAAVTMLVLVRIPGIGTTTLGAQRWFQFAGFQFTPSEFTKIALCIMLAAILSELRSPEPTLRDTLRVCFVAGIPMVLVFIQPDIGTTIVLVALAVGILVVAGARGRHLAAIAIAAIVMIVLAFQLGVIKDYQLARLTGFLDPANNSLTTNYNKAQAEIAIGSGGLFGSGYLKGTQTNLEFVPEQYTDFIFTVAGEELGLVGAGAVIGLLGTVLWRGLRIAGNAGDAFGTIVAAGVVSWLAFQSFVNIGMTLGIMPVTGVPLPFVSYGGSSMFATMMALGLLQNVHMRRYA